MKRLRIWIKEMSLSQQLLTIIFATVIALVVFFFVFLAQNVDNFVESEIYRLLHQSQESFVSYYNSGSNIENYSDNTDVNITHVIYDTKTGAFTILGNQRVSSDVLANLANRIRHSELSNTTLDSRYNNKDKILLYSYSLATIQQGRYCLISIASDSYRVEFKSALVNTVVNLNVLVVSLLLFILMLWVVTLIHPLNQIRNYIDKIRNGEDANLRIDRRDEIGEVADALVVMNDELKEQRHIREEVIQNISHDLKTPIATIKSYAESIKDGVYPYETLEKSVDVIYEHADRLEKKVYSLLMLNKMGYLQDEAAPGETLDMKKVVEEVIISLKVIRPEIAMITDFGDSVRFHGDEESWRIVTENLLDNCLRYAKSQVKITLQPHGMDVSDDGNQITEEDLNRIFRPYEKGTDGKFGLGLSIVYQVCTIYGYTVQAENLTQGVCFRIRRTNSELKKDQVLEKEKKQEQEKERKNEKKTSRKKEKKNKEGKG